MILDDFLSHKDAIDLYFKNTIEILEKNVITPTTLVGYMVYDAVTTSYVKHHIRLDEFDIIDPILYAKIRHVISHNPDIDLGKQVIACFMIVSYTAPNKPHEPVLLLSLETHLTGQHRFYNMVKRKSQLPNEAPNTFDLYYNENLSAWPLHPNVYKWTRLLRTHQLN